MWLNFLIRFDVFTLNHTFLPPVIWMSAAGDVDEVLVTKKVRDSGVDTHLPPKDKHRRINRNRWSYEIQDLREGWYHDCHSLRPYDLHKEEIETVLSLIGEQV